LPNPKTLAKKLERWGIDRTKQVVVYDDSLGAIAARLWWLLRWLGHEAAALLDVGYQKWLHEQRPTTTALPAITPTQFHPTVDPSLWVDTTFVETAINQESCKIIDARAEERYTGDVEPLDKVAGHIPGAVNVPYEDNLAYDSSFQSSAELRKLYTSVLGNKKPEGVIHMCGSGVTACHSILAMEIAGLSGSRLYAGSWSEWIRDSRRPVAKGV
jgi:thiosulfate/3-mercaptopyruvate sulfurtransferase